MEASAGARRICLLSQINCLIPIVIYLAKETRVLHVAAD